MYENKKKETNEPNEEKKNTEFRLRCEIEIECTLYRRVFSMSGGF